LRPFGLQNYKKRQKTAKTSRFMEVIKNYVTFDKMTKILYNITTIKTENL